MSNDIRQERSDFVDRTFNVGGCNLHIQCGFVDDVYPDFELNRFELEARGNAYYEREKRKYIESFMEFRALEAEEQMHDNMAGRHPTGGLWGGYYPFRG